MKSWVLALSFGFLGLMCVAASYVQAQQTQGQDAFAQKWVEFMTPGAEHELLVPRVGKWTMQMELRTAPDAAVATAEGTAEIKMIMGGRFLEGTVKCNIDGQPLESRGTTGYDKLKKKFVSVWIDNFGTGLTTSEGTYDKSARSFNYVTMSPDVASGKYKRTRTVERFVNQDKWAVEMYDTTAEGKEFLMMKAVYKRVK